ncbi:hypothetical protein D3C77_416590 [compost metagenome]
MLIIRSSGEFLCKALLVIKLRELYKDILTESNISAPSDPDMEIAEREGMT